MTEDLGVNSNTDPRKRKQFPTRPARLLPSDRVAPPEQFYTVPEVARLFAVKRDTVLRWIVSERIHAFKPPGSNRWRIPDSEVKRVAQHMYTPENKPSITTIELNKGSNR